MATINAAGLTSRIPNAGAYGNMNTEVFSYKGALSIADILRFPVKMPPYCQAVDGILSSDTANSGATFKLGYAATDGDAAASDDDAFVVAGTAIATATRVRFNAPIVPPLPIKEWYPILTLAGGAIGANTTLTLVLNYIYIGH